MGWLGRSTHGLPLLSCKQDAEKVRQRRSRVAQRLNVPKRTTRLFAAALLDRLFEHPEVILALASYEQFEPYCWHQQSFSADC